jgi:hypothetical protein
LLALSISVHAAEKVDPAVAKKQKSRPVAQKQQFAPKQHMAPKSHIQALPPQRVNKPIRNNTSTVRSTQKPTRVGQCHFRSRKRIPAVGMAVRGQTSVFAQFDFVF